MICSTLSLFAGATRGFPFLSGWRGAQRSSPGRPWWRENLFHAFALVTICVGNSHAETAPLADGGVTYHNVRRPKVPWSIHVVRIPRYTASIQFRAAHACGSALGLAPVTDQLTRLAGAPGVPVAAINGDYYQREGPYAGDPRGLQILDGQLLSAPAGSASFWIDAISEPYVTNTVSKLQVTWPNGAVSAVGLNGNRKPNRIELYTPAIGPSTRTVGGRELVLERQGGQSWLPLQAGKTYSTRIREIRESGDTCIQPSTLVLSIGSAAAGTVPRVQAGAEVVVSTATVPSLRGVRTAISGGPVLLRNGKRQRLDGASSDSYEFSSMLERHPRSAIGWNADFYFLVNVDGRTKGVSVGMTLKELTSYLIELGCQEALNLDGGGSATLWYGGKIQNYLCDGYERPVANSLVVLLKKPPGKTGN